MVTLLMEDVENPLTLDGSLDGFLQRSNNYVIYTHSQKTRYLIMLVFWAYLVVFTMFVRSLFEHFEKLENLPPIFARLEASEGNQWLAYVLAILGMLLAIAFLVYFIWAMLDIWGLQVWCSPIDLKVQNTLTGTALRKYMGTGSLRMEDITLIRGSKFLTYVSGKGVTLRFSPVDQVDSLIATILANAPEARIEE